MYFLIGKFLYMYAGMLQTHLGQFLFNFFQEGINVIMSFCNWLFLVSSKVRDGLPIKKWLMLDYS